VANIASARRSRSPALPDTRALDEAYERFLGAFGAAWDDVLSAHWRANPPGMLWPEMDAGLAPAWRKRRVAGGNQAASDFVFQRDVQAGIGVGLRSLRQGM
jgi:hypothetical protein